MRDPIFDWQAELCRTMGNPARLSIVHALRQGPQRVGDIAAATELAQAKVSQHLAVLRARGIVAGERRGQDVVYRIANPRIVQVCDLMREVLIEQAAERSELLRAMHGHVPPG